MYKELLGEELNRQVKEALKGKEQTLFINNVKESSWVAKEKYEALIKERDDWKTQSKNHSDQVDTLKKTAKDPEKLQEKLDEIKKQYSDLEEKHKTSSMENEIKLQALKEGAKDPSDILNCIDWAKLQLDNGIVKGLEEQIKNIKEKKGYLFGDPKSSVPSSSGANPPNLSVPGDKLAKLQEEFKKAEESRNVPLQMAIQSEIMKLSNKGG